MIMKRFFLYEYLNIIENCKKSDSKWCNIVVYGHHVLLKHLQLYRIMTLLCFVKKSDIFLNEK